MSAHLQPVDAEPRQPAGPWPRLADSDRILRNCGALFIDIRGSSDIPDGAGAVADRARDFAHCTEAIWKGLEQANGAPPPDSVRLIGDGLFCVWKLSSNDSRVELGRHALVLLDRLTEELQARWRLRRPVRLGMGLAFGDAWLMHVGEVADYYGYTVNLASKLQNFARPSGLVIAVADGGTLGELSSEPRLEPRKFALRMAPGSYVECLATPEVDEVHEWTCLAWPGFAVHREKDGQRLGLNTRGITVLTHEGLRGKLDSLKIWPRNGYEQPDADKFEFIIDDFDNLEAMHSDRVLKLANFRDSQITRLVSRGLYADGAPFCFIPVRCGLNAVAWHSREGAATAGHRSYLETLEYASTDNDFSLAMYDNVGASMPILLNAFCPELGKDTFTGASSRHLARVIDGIRELQSRNPYHPLLKFYPEIEELATCLQNATVSAVLGGGAWLADPDPELADQAISVGIPPESRGFLWMEGAALLDHMTSEAANLCAFLRESVLTDQYQKALMAGLAYCSCPVTKSLIQDIVSNESPAWDNPSSATRLVFDDTRRLFADATTIRRDIVPRRKPKLSAEWEDAWIQIKTICRSQGETT